MKSVAMASERGGFSPVRGGRPLPFGRTAGLILFLILSTVAWAQSDPKRIYIAADDHSDYMWAGDEEAYRQAFLDMTDYYLDQADATQSDPADYQSRWNMDGTLWVWTYEQNRTPAEFSRLIDRLRDGHFSVPLNTAVSCYGAQPAEAVLRGMSYAGQLERKYGLKLVMAGSMENQTMPYGLGALWAGAGAQYSWKGVCGCNTKVPALNDRLHDIYWWVGPDGSRILMKWNSLLGDNQSMGGYAEAFNPASTVGLVDGNASFKAHYPYSVIGAFGRGWDALETLTNIFPATAQSQTNEARRVIVSNEQDFFDDFKATYGADLPEESVSYGNEWDLYCTSMAEVSARVKRAVEKLRGAEALATLVSLRRPDFMTGRTAARDLAWRDLGLYWEHCWTADSTVVEVTERADWTRRLAGEIESYVDTLQADATQALAELINKSGDQPRFYAFNPLSWTRTEIADLPYADTQPVHVVEPGSGAEVPSQFVTVDGRQFLRVLAAEVPPVGYKVYEIRPGAGTSFSQDVTTTGSVIENSFYKISVAGRGAITSLIDKTRGGREFVRTINGRQLNDLGPGSGSVQVENAGPVSVTLLTTATAPLLHATRVTLVRNSRRIDIRNDINQNFSGTYSWKFSLNLDRPDVWHEEVGAIIRARLATEGGHYSPTNARYDWLTLNHFADMSSSSSATVGLTLANADCFFMQLGASTPGTLDVNTPQLSVLAGGQVDDPALGIPNQGDDTHFTQRFALQTHDQFDPAEAMRLALEQQNPLLTSPLAGGADYPEQSFSLVNISDPDVLLWALKPAEDGIDHGVVARVWNMAREPRSFHLAQPSGQVTSATQLSHIEMPVGPAAVEDGALSASLAASQLKTFSLKLADLDTTSPRALSIARAESDPTSAAQVSFMVTFSKAVKGVDPSDFSLTTTGAITNASITSLTQEAPERYRMQVATGSGNGTLRLDLVDDDSIVDLAGDPLGNTGPDNGNFTSGEVYTIDKDGPTDDQSSSIPDPTNVSPIPVTVTFSEAVTGFSQAAITLANARIEDFRGSDSQYSFDLIPLDQGLVSASIPAGVARDAAGNPNQAAPLFSRLYDSIAPTVTLASTEADPTAVSRIPVTVTFSEPVTGFTEDDIPLENARVENFRGSGARYYFDLIPLDQGLVTASLPAGVARDAADNPNEAAPLFSRIYDTSRPTVTIFSDGTDPTSVSLIPLTVKFSEPVTGFDPTDLTVQHASLRDFAGSGDRYTFNLVPAGQGMVTVDLAANVAWSVSGNGNLAATRFSRVYDSIRPTVILASTSGYRTNAAAIPVTVHFSEPVNGFTQSDIQTTNSTIRNLDGSGALYSFELQPINQGPVAAAIPAAAAQDPAGNPSGASEPLNRVFDSLPPTANIRLLNSSPTNRNALDFEVDFSESMASPPTSTQVALTGTLAWNGAAPLVAGADPSYLVTVRLTDPDVNGTIGIGLPAGLTDLAGNALASAVQSPEYQIRNLGTLIIHVQPDLAGWKLTGPGSLRIEDHGTTAILQTVTGNYALDWQPMAGWTSPPTQTVTLKDDMLTTLTGIFTRQTGQVVISVSPPDTGWTLSDGDGLVHHGQGTTTLTQISTGLITLTWQTPDGYYPPSPESITRGLTDQGQVSFLEVLLPNHNPAIAEQVLRYLLGLTSDPSGLDANQDGRVDVSDFVYLKLGKPPVAPSLSATRPAPSQSP